MAHIVFGFVAVLAVAAYVYAAGASVLASAAFGILRYRGSATSEATKTVGTGVGVLLAGIVGFAALSLGWEAAVFVALTAGAATLTLGVLPLGLASVVLPRVTDTDDPLGLAVYGWSPSLVVPPVVVYLLGAPATTVTLAALLAVPVIGPTVVGYAVHRFRSR